ncbi:MAG: Flp family type IVb pilin [Candidatus Baltobacteraceae bacterium]
MQLTIRNFLCDDEGSTLTEYGLLAGALAIPMLAAFGAIAAVGGNVLQITGNGLTQVGTNP